MSKIINCEECGIEYYIETIIERESFRHVFPDIVKLESELAEARASLSAIMAVLPDDAKPCDAPDLIRFFKHEMAAYSGHGIKLEGQLAEARAEIERRANDWQEHKRDLIGKLMDCRKEMGGKDALIKQMLEALEKADSRLYFYHLQGSKSDYDLLKELQEAIEKAKEASNGN